MIHRFIDQVAAGVFPYQHDIFDGTNAYDQTWAVPDTGGAPVQITSRTTDGDQDISPCVSPDGTKIAFVRGTSFGSYKLYVADADGSNVVALDTNTGCAAPVWRPDGAKILYRRSNGFRTVNPDGTGNTGITISPAPTSGFILNCATYNYDGTLIAFSVDDNLSGVANTLWVMAENGTGAASISTTTNTGPTISSWSTVANRIAFIKKNGANEDLVACDEDGSNVTTLKASIAGGIMRFAWVRDGSAVIHTHNSPSSGSVYSADATGAGSAALSPALRLLSSGFTGPMVHTNNRVYVVRSSTQDLVSVLPDGSGLRVEDTPDLVGPDFVDLRLLDGGGTAV